MVLLTIDPRVGGTSAGAPLGLETSTSQPTSLGEQLMSELAATFDAHIQAEFQDLDLEATMATMTDDPYVHHVPTITGGNGLTGARDFYRHHFTGQWPDAPQPRAASTRGRRIDSHVAL